MCTVVKKNVFGSGQSSWKRMCLLASLARAMMIFSALDMS